MSLLDLSGRVVATFSAPGLPSGSQFGAALASLGSTLVVGAPNASFDATFHVIGGRAFVYDVSGTKPR